MKKCIFLGFILFCFFIKSNEESSNLSNSIQALIYHKAAQKLKDTSSTDTQSNIRSSDKKQTSIWTEPVIINDKNPMDIITFTSNVIYNPGKNYNYPYYYQSYPAAIIVDKDNVTIDLAGFNLSLDPRSATSFLVNNPTFGIAITAGTKNIKIISSSPIQNYSICKGSISGFTGYAIYALGSTQIINSYDIYQNYIQNIELYNLLITSNASGIYLSNVLQANIMNSDIVYNFSSRPTYGICCANVLQSTIENCNFNQNYSWNTVIGAYLEDTVNCSVINCQASYNRSLKNGDAIGMQLAGTTPLTSSVNTITKCTANTNISSYTSGSESIGFFISRGSHTNIISECKTFHNTHNSSFGLIPPTIGPKGYGIKLERSYNNQIYKNQSGYHSHYGFFDLSLISSSFFTNNIGIFNPTANFIVDIANGSGSEPLPVLEIYQNDLNVYNYETPNFMNLSIKPGSA